MINMTQFLGEKKDNIVVVNGATFKVTDEVTLKILELVSGYKTTSGVEKKEVEKTDKPVKITGLKDVKYHIKKLTSDGKTLFCISRGTPVLSKNNREYLKNGGFTSAEKSCINNSIKSLDGIKEITIKAEFTYKAWGYKTKKEAEAAMATLPTSFSAEEVAKFQRTKRA